MKLRRKSNVAAIASGTPFTARQTTSKTLRALAEQMNACVQYVTQGGALPFNLLIDAGMTIFNGLRNGLFSPKLDGHCIIPDGTVDNLEGRANRYALYTLNFQFPQQPLMSRDQAAQDVVWSVWLYLVRNHQDQLPAELAGCCYELDSPPDRPPWIRPEVDLIKAAWTCRFLAELLDPITKPKLLESQQQMEHIRVAYPDLNEKELERLRKRLEYWGKKNEDLLTISDDAPDRNYRRYSYPTTKVAELVDKLRQQRKGT
jgi:hypothetical protein